MVMFCLCKRLTASDVLLCATLMPHRPCKNKVNQAMIYCVGPEDDQAQDARDFIQAGLSLCFASCSHAPCLRQRLTSALPLRSARPALHILRKHFLVVGGGS